MEDCWLAAVEWRWRGKFETGSRSGGLRNGLTAKSSPVIVSPVVVVSKDKWWSCASSLPGVTKIHTLLSNKHSHFLFSIHLYPRLHLVIPNSICIIVFLDTLYSE